MPYLSIVALLHTDGTNQSPSRQILPSSPSQPSVQNLRVVTEKRRGPAELVWHFACRGNSHRRKGAARHIIDMVGYIAKSQWGGGRGDILFVRMISTCPRGA
jgi:hypothetical protein